MRWLALVRACSTAVAIDVRAARAETPSTARAVHLNAAGASPPPARVLRAQVAHLELEAEVGGYAAADATADAQERVYASCARLLNAASPSEIALLDSSSMAFAHAIYSVPLKPGDVMLSLNDAEYGANAVAMLQHARRNGARVCRIPSTPSGGVDLRALREHLTDALQSKQRGEARSRIAAVCLTHVPSNSGVVADAEGVGALLRSMGSPEDGGPLFLLDACQSVGQLSVDVQTIGCDFAASTGRKWLRAPRGTGMLFARGALLAADSKLLAEPPILDHASAEWLAPEWHQAAAAAEGGTEWAGCGGDGGRPSGAGGLGQLGGLGSYRVRADARRFQFWEGSVAARLGLGAAVDYALELGPGRIEAAVRARAAQIRGALVPAVRGVRLADLSADGDGACGLSGIVALDVEKLGGARAVHATLARQGIHVGIGSQGSTALDAARRQLPALLRVSAHYFADDGDVEALVRALHACARAAGA